MVKLNINQLLIILTRLEQATQARLELYEDEAINSLIHETLLIIWAKVVKALTKLKTEQRASIKLNLTTAQAELLVMLYAPENETFKVFIKATSSKFLTSSK